MFEQEERHAGCMFEQEEWQSSNCLWSACFDAVGNLMHVCMRCMSSLARECNNYLNWNSHSGVSVWDYTYCMMEDCHVNSSLLVVSSRILTTFCLPSSRPAWSWITKGYGSEHISTVWSGVTWWCQPIQDDGLAIPFWSSSIINYILIVDPWPYYVANLYFCNMTTESVLCDKSIDLDHH